MSYIVKNCPAIYGIDDGFLCSYREDEDEKYCYDCTDCFIKQVIEIAKDIIEKDCYENSDVKAEKILQLFNIEEVQ